VIKPELIATFLGRKLHANYQSEAGGDFDTRVAGTGLKHAMGSEYSIQAAFLRQMAA